MSGMLTRTTQLDVDFGANDIAVFITMQAGLETGHYHEKEAKWIFLRMNYRFKLFPHR